MKAIIIIMLLFSYITSDTTKNNKKNVLDDDYMKNEMQDVILDFIEDVGLNPDSCYIPFTD